ncbi:MAG: penicillin-binding protein activator [Desulfobacteraceae bacterium]|nr:penicillin-binding protein activator [Desulfobacteraceae bacterium]
MKLYWSNKTFIALVGICFFVFYSCVQKKQQEIINIPPFPMIHPNLINTEICKEQNQQLIEIEKLFFKKSFKKALKMGAAIIENPCSPEHYIQALEWIGDIFNEREEKTNAFCFYGEALEYMEHETSQAKARALIKKIVAVTSRMKVKKTISLLAQIQKKDIHSQILFQSGLIKIETGNEADAVFLLDEFVKNFSQHKDIDQVKLILKRIKENNEFKKTRIGVLLPLTGYYQLAGHRVLDAIQLAVNEFNNTQSTIVFHLLVKDTASDQATAAKAVKKLEKEKVSCIIGPMVTVRSAAIESNNLGIPMILMSQKSNVTKIGQFILRNYMTPTMQIRAGISYFLDKYGFTRFAILYPNEKYGIAFKNAFIDTISMYDAQLTAMVSYEPSQTDFSDQITQFIIGYQKIDENGEYVDMKDDEVRKRNRIYRAKIDFDVLFIPDTASKVNMIAPQLKYHGIEAGLMGTNLWNSKKLLMAKDYVQTAIFPDGFYPESESKRVLDFVTSYFQTFGDFPEYTEAIAYDTAMIVMEALSSQAVRSRKDMVNYLQSNTFSNGLTCPTSFDLQGEPDKSLELLQVIGNEIKLIRSCNN